MATITVNDEAMAAIRSAIDGDVTAFRETAVRRGTGWEVPVGDDVVAAIDDIRFPGETDSDVIVRMVAGARAGGAN